MKAFYYTALSTSTELATELGDNGDIVPDYPDTIETFPLIIYSDDTQSDTEYAENKPTASSCRVTF